MLFMLYKQRGFKFAFASMAFILLVLTGPWVAMSFAADVVPVPDAPAVAAVNLYVVALGFLTPLAGYLLNYVLPTTTAQVKGIVQGALAAGVGVLVGAASGADIGLNEVTLLNAATAVLVSVGGHLAFRAGDVNGFFGGGKNRQNTGDRLFQTTPG